jgi:predicted signal transduction protein with EAL and GGDEF domain
MTVTMRAQFACADAAMYHAKENGRNTNQFFMPGMKTPHPALQRP